MAAPGPGWVWMYNDGNFKGTVWKFCTDCASLNVSDANDKVSSIQLGAGVQVRLYADDNFRGADVHIPVSTGAMPKGFNDKCSSFKIVAGAIGGPAPGEVWFFQGENYQGHCWAFPSGAVPSLSAYGANDKIRSVRLGPGTQVQVWKHEKMTGQTDIFTSDRSKLLNGFASELSSFTAGPIAAAPAAVPAADGTEANWMGTNSGLIGDLRLAQVPMVGTHDAGAYKIGGGKSPDAPDVLGKLPSILHSIIEDWALAQGKDFEGQLKDGVRYFDIRMSWHDDKNEVWTCHSFFCSSFAEILDDVRRFSTLHPKEIIILRLSHWYTSPKQATFPVQPTLAAITAGLGATLMNNKTVPNPFNSTLNQLWAAPCGRVIVLWEEEGRARMPPNDFTYSLRSMYPGFSSVDMWPGPFAPIPLRRLSFLSMDTLRRNISITRGLNVTYMQADGERFLLFVMVPNAKAPPEDEADVMSRAASLRGMNEQLSKHIASWAALLGLCPNVITVDYQEDSKVAAAVIANLPRFVGNIRRNIPTPITPAEGGPWAIMSSRGRYLGVKDNKVTASIEKLSANAYWMLQNSPAGGLAIRVAGGYVKFTAIGVELLPAFNTPPTATESFTLQAVAQQNTLVYTIHAGPNLLSVDGDKIVLLSQPDKFSYWSFFRIDSA